MGGSFSNLLTVSFQGIRVLEKRLGHLWHITSHQSETSKKDYKIPTNQPKSIPNPPQIDPQTTPNRLKIASGGPKIAEERPRTPQERPQGTPRPPQDRPRPPLRPPKSAPRPPKSAPRPPKTTPRAAKSAPRPAKILPRWPKSDPRSSQDRPRSIQDGFQTLMFQKSRLFGNH